ncbi:MAG: hypothetical protein PHI12_08565 [Dehalococcoidales bacterium]|nr:hypothetical protein [Dehalococcoidales bacterium]
MGQYSRRVQQLLLGQQGASYQIWPAPTGVPATGVAVVSGAGAWGNVADIVAAGAIATEFWCVGLFIQTLGGGAIQAMEFIVASTGPAAGNPGPVTTPFIFQFRVDPSLVTLDYGFFPLPYPVYKPAGTRVCYCAGGAAARSMAVSLAYAINL